jgi:hypothetical protein
MEDQEWSYGWTKVAPVDSIWLANWYWNGLLTAAGLLNVCLSEVCSLDVCSKTGFSRMWKTMSAEVKWLLKWWYWWWWWSTLWLKRIEG